MSDLSVITEAFHFLRPLWLLGLIPAAALALLFHRRHRDAGNWSKVIAPHLLPHLLDGSTGSQPALAPWCLAAWVLACLGLAGPTWKQVPLPIHKQESALVILMDLSPSMLAQDIKPDRLTRARLKLIDLLKQRKEGTTGLVAFAGDAHVVTPLTDDTTTIISQVPALDPNIMPLPGSNPEAALEAGIELVMNEGRLEGDLLLITDGITSDARETLERLLRSTGGFTLSVLGIGTDEGAPIPLGDGGFARDSNGGIVIAGLRSEELRGMAARQGGRYATLTGDDRDIRYLLEPMGKSGDDRMRALERNFDTWEDNGFWLAIALLPLAVLAFRRGLLALLLVVPLLHSPPTQASLWDDLWLRRDQQGARAMEQNDPQTARQLFRDDQWQGTAAYRSGDFQAAAETFAGDTSATGHYNRGNALARAGDLEKAIAAYDRALAMDPGMKDAAFNKKLLEQLKDRQNQPQGQDNQSPEQQDNRNQPGDNSPQDQPGGDSGEQEQSDRTDRQQEQPGKQEQQQRAGDQQNENGGQPSESGGQPEDQPGQARTEDGDQSPEQSRGEQPKEQPKESQSKTQSGEQAWQGQQREGEPSEEMGAGEAQPSAGMTEEERQAMEQWLRRVPEDPGGLLRRKFQYESRRRILERRRGLRSPPDRQNEERW